MAADVDDGREAWVVPACVKEEVLSVTTDGAADGSGAAEAS